MFDLSQVKSSVNAETAESFMWGYFSNNLADLRRTVEKGKTNLSTVYTYLESVLNEKAERRFCTTLGNFALFYPTERSENPSRY